MAAVTRLFGNHLKNLLSKSNVNIISTSQNVAAPPCLSWMSSPFNALGAMVTRTYYADWRMLRDVKRRRLVKEHHRDRLRINCIRKNTILPDEIKEIADREIAAFPRDSCHVRIRDRCAITSRPRAVQRKWRLSRIMWRSVADGGNMSGAQRSMW